MTETPHLLVACGLSEPQLDVLRLSYQVHHVPDVSQREAVLREVGDHIRAVLTVGTSGWSKALIDLTPNLEIISTVGVGYENVDLNAAHQRGIVVTHGRGTNEDVVADHAMALLLAVVRQIPQLHETTQAGLWQRPLLPSITGKKLGILGLGRIGQHIARRASGFALEIHYHNRHKTELPYQYTASVEELASKVDFLVVASPGGEDTHHLVNGRVLDLLGPQGYLVNIARGSVVDTAALIEALREGRIAGAGLDVFEGEPQVPEGLRHLSNVVLTPHVGGNSPESLQRMFQLVLENFRRHFAGERVLTPVWAQPVSSS